MRPPLILSILAGILLGLSVFTVWYAEGLSYLGSNPKSCANCHIMNSQYDSWLQSSHHAVATCSDCHLPHDFFRKVLAKSQNGWHHSKGFTLQNFQEPIQIKPGNARILQDNCILCHGDLVHPLLAGTASGAADMRCVRCHRSAGHGDIAGLGGPDQGEQKERERQ